MGSFFLSLFFLLLPAKSLATEECWKNSLALSAQENWNLETRNQFYAPLSSRNTSGQFLTSVIARIEEEDGSAEISFYFDTPFYSLPYSIYKIQFEIGHPSNKAALHYEIDFTDSCSNIGISIFPRGKIYLNPIQIPQQLRGTQPMQIKIWGHL